MRVLTWTNPRRQHSAQHVQTVQVVHHEEVCALGVGGYHLQLLHVDAHTHAYKQNIGLEMRVSYKIVMTIQ